MLGKQLDQIKKMLDEDYEIMPQKAKKRRLRPDPVLKLAQTLKKYKEERIGVEADLIKTIDKVNLDRSILLKEKQSVLWKNEPKTQIILENELKHQKKDRYVMN